MDILSHRPARDETLRWHYKIVVVVRAIIPNLTNDRFGIIPNRPLERLFKHFLSLISLSGRFRLPAGILSVVLSCRSPQQTTKPSARPSNETESESNDRFGIIVEPSDTIRHTMLRQNGAQEVRAKSDRGASRGGVPARRPAGTRSTCGN